MPRVVYDPSQMTRSEATVLGGLKTKNVDIVVTKDGIGPVLAVSCKGMTGAVRNLTNWLARGDGVPESRLPNENGRLTWRLDAGSRY